MPLEHLLTFPIKQSPNLSLSLSFMINKLSTQNQWVLNPWGHDLTLHLELIIRGGASWAIAYWLNNPLISSLEQSFNSIKIQNYKLFFNLWINPIKTAEPDCISLLSYFIKNYN